MPAVFMPRKPPARTSYWVVPPLLLSLPLMMEMSGCCRLGGGGTSYLRPVGHPGCTPCGAVAVTSRPPEEDGIGARLVA